MLLSGSLCLKLPTVVLDQVYQVLKDKVRDAVISLVIRSYSMHVLNDSFLNKWYKSFLFRSTEQINRERDGEQVDKTLLKNVLNIFVEIGSGKTHYYETDFEAHMLRETSTYYSQKASIWIVEYSCPDYMFKVITLILFELWQRP